MCCIIHKPRGIDIPQDVFQRVWNKNPHGAGFMYADHESLQIVKGLMTLGDFMEKYVEHKCIEKELIIHFRLASVGAIVPEQTHPFWVFPNQLAFAHNGHMMQHETSSLSQSDTMIFNQEILSKLPPNFLSNEGITKLLSDYLCGSILAFMDNLGKIKILGDTFPSIFFNNCWFSNDFWQIYEKSENCSSETTDSFEEDDWDKDYDFINELPNH